MPKRKLNNNETHKLKTRNVVRIILKQFYYRKIFLRQFFGEYTWHI